MGRSQWGLRLRSSDTSLGMWCSSCLPSKRSPMHSDGSPRTKMARGKFGGCCRYESELQLSPGFAQYPPQQPTETMIVVAALPSGCFSEGSSLSHYRPVFSCSLRPFCRVSATIISTGSQPLPPPIISHMHAYAAPSLSWATLSQRSRVARIPDLFSPWLYEGYTAANSVDARSGHAPCADASDHKTLECPHH